MSPPARELRAILRSVHIQSEVAFSFAGPPPQAAAVERDPSYSMDPEALRRLVAALRDRLYEIAFTRPFGSAAGPVAEAPPDLARRLSEANHGRDIWSSGWRVVEIDPSGDIVARKVVEPGGAEWVREVRLGEYAPSFAEDVRPSPGSPVMVRFPRASWRMQKGYYYAFGSALPTADDERLAARLYFGAAQSDVPVLFDAITRALGEAKVPFTMKTVLNPADAARRDATVLYVPRRFFPEARRAVMAIPEPVRARLGPGAPLFTKLIHPGVGAADHPGPKESFGMHRCRLLAEGIVDAWIAGREDEPTRLRAVEARFAREGLSLDRPHLSAGSEDVYDPVEPAARGAQESGDVESARSVATSALATPPSRVGGQPITAETLLARLGRYGLPAGAGARVIDRTSRNRNFLVELDGRDGYFVKQLRVPGAESFAMMEREATLYRLVQDDPGLAALRGLLPVFYGFEPESAALFLGAPRDAESLAIAHHRASPPAAGVTSGPEGPSWRPARAAGEALSSLHRAPDSAVRDRLARALPPAGPPGVYTAHRGGPLLRWLGPGQRLLVDRAAGVRALAKGLDELAASWRPEALVHGDIKGENILCRAAAKETQSASGSIKLVDWELCDLGDPAWDTGCLIQSYITFWALSGPMRPGLSLRARVPLSAVPLASIAPAARAVWEGYQSSHPSGSEDRQLLERTLRSAAARVFQSALERMHGLPEPPPPSLVLLDLAAEAMEHPSTLGELFGLG